MKKVYKLLLKVNLLFKYVATFGVSKGIHVFIQTRFWKSEAAISLTQTQQPIYLRSQTSDFDVFNQVFLVQEYKFPIDDNPAFIIDCGANIGLTSVFFRNKYPSAFIVSVEPEDTNFAMLKKNTASYSNIDCVQSGIWNRDVYLKIENTSSEKWSFTCRETTQAEAGSIPAISIGSIMKKHNRKQIDILKIDIEGSEREVFSDNIEDWLPYTKTIMIELHDDLKRGCSKAFFLALYKYDFSFDVRGKGKTIICTRNEVNY